MALGSERARTLKAPRSFRRITVNVFTLETRLKVGDVRALLGVGIVARKRAALANSAPNYRQNLNKQAALGIDGLNDANRAEVNDLVTD
jgi:hypothetical protein